MLRDVFHAGFIDEPPGCAGQARPRALRSTSASHWVGLCLATAVLSATVRTQAAPLHETYGAWSSATPFEARVLPSGAEATYFNPALLIDARHGAQVGFVLIRETLHIDLQDRPSGVDVAETIFDARAVNPDGSTRRLDQRPLPTAALQDRRSGDADSSTRGYLTLGMNLHLIPERVAIGVQLLLPTRTFQTQRSFFADEREQYFSNSLHYELHGDRLETNLVTLAIAGRIVEALSVGAGVTMSNEGRAENQTFVPDGSDQNLAVINTQVEVRTRFSPHVGVDVRPVEPLHVVATVHFPYANDTKGDNELQLWNFEYEPGQSSFRQSFDYQSHTTPLRAAIGAGWRPTPDKPVSWSAAATAVWTRWSTYLDRHREAPEDEWFDTFSVSAGGAYKWHAHRLGVDVAYVPSPVPAQTGRSNYVDNHRLAGAVSYAVNWQMAGAAFEAGLQLQVHRLLPRSVTKSADASHPVIDEFPNSVDARTGLPIPESQGLQTNNPGYPGFSSEGWLTGGSVTLSWRF